MPVCAIYARVSDEMQAKGESVAHQVSFLREFARRKAQHGEQEWIAPDEFVFCDEGISGTTMIKRPAVQLLLMQARVGGFAVVLFKGISRFARDTVDALVMLRTLQAYGLRVISFEENYDSEKESAELIFTMHSAVAQYESEKIGIRVRVGNFEKARAGKWAGRVPDGYQLDPESKQLLVHLKRAEVIRQIFGYAQAGLGNYRIAQRLNEMGIVTSEGRTWTAVKVQRIIENPVYMGDVMYGRRIRKLVPPAPEEPFTRRYQVMWNSDTEAVACAQNVHPAIVSREVFSRVQKSPDQLMRQGRIGHPHGLTGLIFCACGEAMKVKNSGHHVTYFRCLGAGRIDRVCRQPYLRMDAVETAVQAALHRDLTQIYDAAALEQVQNEHVLMSPEVLHLLIKKVWVVDANQPYALAIAYHWR